MTDLLSASNNTPNRMPAVPVVPHSWLRRKRAELGLLALCLFLFCWNLGSAPLLDLDEALYVTCAQQMTVSGDWITPRLNTQMPERPGVRAIPFFEKPILVYWVSAGSMRLFGRNVWAARLPVALAALLTTFLVYAAGRRWFGRRAGLLSGMVYATVPMTLVDARQMTTDGLLVCWLTIALLCFRHGEEEEEKRRKGEKEKTAPNLSTLNSQLPTSPSLHSSLFTSHWLGFWLMCALAVLTKGAVGLLPFLIIGAYLLLRRIAFQLRLRTPAGPRLRFALQLRPLQTACSALKRLRPLPGLLLFLAAAAPWHLAIARSMERDAQGRTWVKEYIQRQHIGRFKGLDTVHNQPLPTYFVYFLLGFFPWACFAPAAFRLREEKEKRRKGEEETQQGERKKEKGKRGEAASSLPELPNAGRPLVDKHRTPNTEYSTPHTFLLVWFWTIFVFFSLGAAKLPTYITPAYPAAALLIGRWLDSVLSAGKQEGEEQDEGMRRTGRSLQRGALGALAVGLLLFVGIAIAPRFAPPAAPIPPQLIVMGWHLALTFIVGSGLAWFCFRQASQYAGRLRGIAALAAIMVVTTLILTTEGYDALRDSVLGPYQQLAALARPDAQAGIPVLYFNVIPRRPSMNFYAGYAPFEHQETPLLPFLARCMPQGVREADLVLTREAQTRLLMPEIAATPGASMRSLQQRGPNGEWLLTRVVLPRGYVPPADTSMNLPPRP